MARRVLFLGNDRTAPPGLLGEVFAESGFGVETFEVVPGDDPVVEVSFPDPAGYDVIVPLGARWGVYDVRLPWVAGEIALVRAALAAGAGVLGVCFGGQLLATALGGTVARSPAPEIGWAPVHTADPALIPAGPWFQWHLDRFTVPTGAATVAWNDCAPQAFVQGRALGLQFHPEVDAALVEQWIAEDTGDLAALGIDAAVMRARTAAVAADAAARLRLLVAGFLALRPDQVAHRADRLG